MKKEYYIKDSKYGLSTEAIKLIFRMYYKEKLNTFEIKDELNNLLEEKISLTDIANILKSDLSKTYKDVNIDVDIKKINKDLIDTRNKERESNKDLQGVFLNE